MVHWTRVPKKCGTMDWCTSKTRTIHNTLFCRAPG